MFLDIARRAIYARPDGPYARLRSFEKLTAEGMTLLEADVAQVLDEALPARFGGRPGDYQLVEEEGLTVGPASGSLFTPGWGGSSREWWRTLFLRIRETVSEKGLHLHRARFGVGRSDHAFRLRRSAAAGPAHRPGV